MPEIDASAFRLRMEGLLDDPYSLNFNELEAMKDVTEFITLECIGNPVGGDAIGNALWEG